MPPHMPMMDAEHFNPRSPHGERLRADRLASASIHFNPRSPHGERRARANGILIVLCISIHAPRTGSDRAAAVRAWNNDISIHAPRTGSDSGSTVNLRAEPSISIHAPRTGSDTVAVCCSYRWKYFNPRSPHGERLDWVHVNYIRDDISIHAPRTGSDDCYRKQLRAEWAFQSTLPARGATLRELHGVFGADISIHAPRTGSDEPPDEGAFLRSISIHAPRTGSDDCAVQLRADHHMISIHAPRTGSD